MQYEKLEYICLEEIMLVYIQNNIVVFLSDTYHKEKTELISLANHKFTIINFCDGYHNICYYICDNLNFFNQFKKLIIEIVSAIEIVRLCLLCFKILLL